MVKSVNALFWSYPHDIEAFEPIKHVQVHRTPCKSSNTKREREREREKWRRRQSLLHISKHLHLFLWQNQLQFLLVFSYFALQHKSSRRIYIYTYIYICKVVCKDHNQLSQVPPWHSSLPLRAKLLVLLKPYWLSSFGQLRSISNPFVVLFEFLRAASHWTYFPASVSRLPGKPLASQILQSLSKQLASLAS